jgi:hypothetical protein
MMSVLFSYLFISCTTEPSVGKPNPVDVPLEIESVTVIPAQGIRSNSYMQCVPSVSGADYETLEIRYTWRNETTQEDLGGNYDLTLSSEMVDIDDEIRCVVLATDASGEVAERYDAVSVEQVIFPLSSALGIFDGERSGDQLGIGLARLGDVDGDGGEEFVMGAPEHSAADVKSGKVYLMKSYEDDISSPTRSFLGVDAKNFLGRNIESAGYIDGDARPDLLLGATGADIAGVDSGAVYLLTFEDYWYTGSTEIDLSAATRIFLGEEAGDRLGGAMLGPGDIDGDGLGDIVLGSANHSSVGYLFGRVYTYLSGSSEPLIIDGASNAGFFGATIASPGDLDGDGIPELWISAPGGSTQRSAIYLFSGLDLADGEASLDDAQLIITATEYGTDFGRSLETGDLDGDGVSELFVGAQYDNTTGYQAGAIYVFYPDLYRSSTDLSDMDAGLILYGEGPENKVGSSFALLDDEDGDGGVELLVGAPGFSGQYTHSGKVYYIPSAEILDPILDLSLVRRSFVGESDHDEAGHSVASLGDLDGDGLGEILIAAPYANGSASDSGRVYLISSNIH